MNKKICHLTSVHSRYDTRIFQKMCTSLACSEYTVYLVVADGKGNEIKNSVNFIDIRFKKGRLRRLLYTSKKILEKSIELDCDLYHFHDPELLPIALKLKKIGKKVIFDSHEYLPAQVLEKHYIPKVIRKFISYLIKKYYKLNVKKLDAVIVVSPYYIDKFKIFADNVHMITNFPVLGNKFTNFKEEEYQRRDNLLLYAGTIYRISQQDLILKAIENMDDIQYRLIGNILPTYKTELLELPAWKKVDFGPFIPKEELDQVLKTVSIGLAIYDYTPNWGYKRGSLGVNKIFEYMLNGLPMVCTDYLEWKNIIDKYKCGLYVNPWNVNEIREAIKYLKNNKDEAYKMGQNGRKAVLKEYNWKSQEKKLLAIYKTILI